MENSNNNGRRGPGQRRSSDGRVITNSEQYLIDKMAGAKVPELSSKIANGVSAERKEMLREQIEAGVYREKGAAPMYMGGQASNPYEDDFHGKTKLGNVSHSSAGPRSSLVKKGESTVVTSGGGGYRGNNDTVRQAPEVYSPLWLNSNLSLPRDRATINAWSRSFFALNPIVNNAISLHSTYPIAKLKIKAKDPKVEKFFSEMIEEIDLMNICVLAAQEYWVLGEAFIYSEMDESKGKWSRLMILNPDYVNVQRNVVASEPIISLRPDENLRRVVFGNQPGDIAQRQQLDPSIIEHVRNNNNIPLNNFYVHHMARKISPYEVRGTGLITSCFRSLILYDKLKENKYVQADSLVNPLTLVKIGDQDFRPTPQDLENFRNIFEGAQYDKDFKIFTHNAVTVEKVGSGQGIYDISNDIERLTKEIYIGLMVPSVIMDGSDTTYATGSVALDVLRQRYMQFRQMMTSWLKRKIFAPIAQINEFYAYEGGEKTLQVPDVDWNHMSLFDMDSYINNLVNLSQGEGAQKRVSLQTLYRSIGLEYEEEQRKIKYEDIQDAIRIRELAAMQRYSIHELKSLSPGDDIEEVADEPVPGESPYEPADQAAGGPAGGGGLGGGLGGPALPGAPPAAPIGGGGAPKPPAKSPMSGGGGTPPPIPV